MLKTLACLVALVSGAALADGVPLITAGPALAASDTARQLQATKMPDFVKLHPVNLNRAAFGANILTVMIDGKEYRFVGSMMPKKPPTPKAVKEKQPETDSWYGKEPGGGRIALTRDATTGALLGTINLLPARTFQISSPPKGSVVLVETDRSASPPLVYFPASSAPSAPALSASGGTR